MERFRDRTEAGRLLAERLRAYAGRPDVVVLGLPRGGLPVGEQVARALGAPLDVFVVRKIGVPGQEELAMGAIASGPTLVLNREVVEALGIPSSIIQAAAAREQEELHRREEAYRGDRDRIDVRDRTVLVVDDGLATGSTMRAALRALRVQGPASLVAAVPVAAAETCRDLESEADQVVCLATPFPFQAVGLWYEDFSQTTDEEVRQILRAAAARMQAGSPGGSDVS